MKRLTTIFEAILVIAILLGPAPHAATPPGLVNYQGVLRDAADKPLDGDHDMVFRFFTAETGGDEILIDRHTTADSEAVTVSGGLFSVWLGSGAIQDGSGPGTWTSLPEVFADHTEVWLRVEVGGEVLDPRVRVVAAPYAINADRLDGRQASGFINTTSTPQAKNGQLTLNSTAPDSFGLDVYAPWGAYFEDSDESGEAWVAWGDVGIWAYGNSGGGHFEDMNSSGLAKVGYGDYGIQAYGDIAGGTFENTYGGSFMHAGRENYGLRAYGNSAGGTFDDLDSSGSAYVAYGDAGIHATGDSYGGFFQDTNATGFAYVGIGDYGIQAYGNFAGATFENILGGSFMHAGREDYGLRASGNVAGGTFGDLNGSGYAYVGYGNRGIDASGTEMGGYFEDSDSSGFARAGWSDYGIWAAGNFAGGEFHDRNESGYALLGHQGYGIWAAGGSSDPGMGGFFEDQAYANWARVADQGSKITGNGAVSFVQNHPELADRVIVYTAPEGDEVATYTRGTARLAGGEARVSLGETFEWVTNPDIGLTAHVTPRGEPIALSVASISTEELVVLGPANSDATFDYLVYGLRIGFEERSVVEEKTIESFIPSMDHNRDRYEQYPELRRFNALERFKVMTTEVEGIDAVDLSRAAELKAAIQEYDSEVHGSAEQLLGHGRPRPDQEIAEGAASEAYDDGASPGEPAHPAIAGVTMTGATDGRFPPDRLRAVELRGDPLPASAPVEVGQVLAFDPEHPGKVRAAATMADPAVIGVAVGMADDALEARVVLTGPVECEVDAGYGAIRAGDMLTTSPTPGHAMRAIEALPGTILGKALEPLESGTGTIRILVMPR